MSATTILGPVSTLARAPRTGEINLDFRRSLPEGLTFTRATQGCYIDALGYPRIAEPDVPMFEKGGLLLDAAGTNYLPNSEYDSVGNGGQRWWANTSRVTVESVHKFGDITMARFRETAGAYSSYMGSTYQLATPVPLVTGQPICVSAFVRPVAGATQSRLVWTTMRASFTDGGTADWRVGFRGSAAAHHSGFADEQATREAVVERLADGVFRVGLVITPLKDGTLDQLRFVYNSDLSVNTRDLDGSGAVEIGGLQISLGRMTSYIRSGSGPAFREADSVVGTIPGLFRPDGLGGTVLADVDVDGAYLQWSQPIYIGPSQSGTTNDGIILNVSTGNSVKWQVGSPTNYNQGVSAMPVFPGPERSGIRLQPGSVRTYAHGDSGNTSSTMSAYPNPGYLRLIAQGSRRFRFRLLRVCHDYIDHSTMRTLTQP